MPFVGLWKSRRESSGAPATYPAGTNANESLQFLGALGVWASPAEATCPTRGLWSLAPALLLVSSARTSGSEVVSKLDNQEDRREAPVPL